ncbi:cyanophycinase [Ideonella sp. BN130291]|uniref:cyanophycinase n=1 Tax=Ideonella sp. BN130291 TaxID=3112940 RepID=UPI002E25E0E6|nr:cyanophycinase [Ideonella sp. BN130291]
MKKPGHLVIVGGAEEREGDMPVLQRFVELLPQGQGPVLVLTAATEEPEEMWKIYRRGFHEIGVKRVEALHVDQRDQANDAELYEKVRQARGVFMTGGDQKKLLALVSGTRLCEAMRESYIERGICIGGTSAGASAMSEHMLGHMASGESPITTDVSLVVGLGFVLNAVIDQHFSERGRLSRLLAVVAHNPKLIGVGIDENTALVVSRGRGIEVIGAGAVTLVDGREMRTRIVGEDDKQVFQATDVRVHLLPAGGGFIAAHPNTKAELVNGDVSPHVQALVQLLAGKDAVDTQFRTDD